MSVIIGYADFETVHAGDILADTGLYIGKSGNTVHLFSDPELTQDTGRIPESRVKCGGLIIGPREFTVDTVTDLLKMLFVQRVKKCYFHNLAFDEYYIAYELYEHDNDLDLGHGVHARSAGRSIGTHGELYSSTIEFTSSTGRHIRHCRLQDSAKIWAQKLETLGEMVGVHKGHEALRVGCDDILKEYCLQDCRVLQTVMEKYFELVGEITHGKYRGWLTSASTAYNLGRWMTTNLYGVSEKQWDAFFPPCNEENGFPSWLRRGYKGATPLLNPTIKGKIIHGVSVFDINSDYPYQMCTQKLPCGPPVDITDRTTDDGYWKLQEQGVLTISRVLIRAHVKQGHRATFLLKHKGPDGSTLASSIDTDDPQQDPWHVVTNIDAGLLERDYDIEYFHPLQILAFDTPRDQDGPYNVFKPFLMYWYDIKRTNKAIDKRNGNHEHAPLIAFAKLIINSFYGKFGANPVFEGREYEFNGPENPLKLVTSDGDIEIDDKPKYLPFAIFTTSYARDLLSRVCNVLGWQNIAYTDTDSVHVFNISGATAKSTLEAHGFVCDGGTLGGWDLEEEDCPMALYLRPKGYVHADADGVPTHVKMAGANGFAHLKSIQDFTKPGAYATKNTGYKVIGGKIIFTCNVNLDDTDGLTTRLKNRAGRTIEGEKAINDFEAKLARKITLEMKQGDKNGTG